MNLQQTRSNKGYHNIPIYYAPKRRSVNSSSPEPDSPTLSYPNTDHTKYDKKWLANKLSRVIGVAIVVVIFFVVTITIYEYMPSAESSLPPENITKHELHSTINDIISPQFNVDESIINTIPQINPMQTFKKSTNSIKDKSKNAVVYFLEEAISNDKFCTLLMSIASTISSTTSSDNNNIELIVFMHYTFAIDTLDLDMLAVSMNFKLIKYELNDGSMMLEHIIRKLKSLDYDSIIYLNSNVFVLQDLSILFKTISFEKHHFGGIWSFHTNYDNQYEQCLLPSMFIMNIHRIIKYNLNYIQMFKTQSMCNNKIVNDNNHINIDTTLLNKIKEISNKYGIVSLPWWYVMDHSQFKTYYGGIKEKHANTNNDGFNYNIGVLSWLKYMNLFESKTHSEPIPLLIDLTTFNDVKDDLFWSEWSSKRQTSIEFCQNIAS